MNLIDLIESGRGFDGELVLKACEFNAQLVRRNDMNKSIINLPSDKITFDESGYLVPVGQFVKNPAKRKALLKAEISLMEARLEVVRDLIDQKTRGRSMKDLRGLEKAQWSVLAEEHGALMSNICTAKLLLVRWVNLTN